MGAEAFESLVGGLDYPMFIVTTAAGGERDGCLVGFACQCSIDPPRFLVCVSDKNRTYRLLQRASAMVVHFVPADAGELVELFGGVTADDDPHKLDRCEWRPGPDGLPLLADAPSWFAGRILDRIPLGDHVGHVLDPFDGRDAGDRDRFPFSRAKRIEPGHEA